MHPRPPGLRVKSLNCRKQPEVLKSVLNTADPSVWDVLCIQEPPITLLALPSFRHARWNLLTPTEARSGTRQIRSAIYVSHALPSDSYTQIPAKSLDITAIQFSFFDFSFSLFSIYNPPNTDLTIAPLRDALRAPALRAEHAPAAPHG